MADKFGTIVLVVATLFCLLTTASAGLRRNGSPSSSA